MLRLPAPTSSCCACACNTITWGCVARTSRESCCWWLSAWPCPPNIQQVQDQCLCPSCPSSTESKNAFNLNACLCRVELVRDTGRTLRAFDFMETDAGRAAAAEAAAHSNSASKAGADGPVGSEFRGVRRSDLLRVLKEALPPGVVTSGAKVARVVSSGGSSSKGGSSSSSWAVLELEGGQKVEAGVVVGADGVRSAVASPGTGLGLAAPRYAG